MMDEPVVRRQPHERELGRGEQHEIRREPVGRRGELDERVHDGGFELATGELYGRHVPLNPRSPAARRRHPWEIEAGVPQPAALPRRDVTSRSSASPAGHRRRARRSQRPTARLSRAWHAGGGCSPASADRRSARLGPAAHPYSPASAAMSARRPQRGGRPRAPDRYGCGRRGSSARPPPAAVSSRSMTVCISSSSGRTTISPRSHPALTASSASPRRVRSSSPVCRSGPAPTRAPACPPRRTAAGACPSASPRPR